MILFFYRMVIELLLWLAKLFGLAIAPLFHFIQDRNAALMRWKKRRDLAGAWWFHVSSVGELEQVRPVLESLKDRLKSPVIITYFSQSVPNLVKDWSFVAGADFLPIDSRKSMQEFFEALRPKVLILNRYDLWPEMLEQARVFCVPVVLINASTPPLGIFGALSLSLRRFLFLRIAYWTYVDTAAATAWEPFAAERSRGLVTGNPRVARALLRVEQKKAANPAGLVLQLQNFCHHRAVLVAGSTWLEDEVLLLGALQILKRESDLKNILLLVVPHEPTPEHLRQLEKKISDQGLKYFLASPWPENPPIDCDIIIGNTRGILVELYGLGKSAYVGGGFGRQVHSVIEPLAHGLPIALGPRHHRSPEVQTLLALGAAYVAEHPRKSAENLAQWLADGLRAGEKSLKAKEALALFMRVHRGAGERIAAFLLEELGE